MSQREPCFNAFLRLRGESGLGEDRRKGRELLRRAGRRSGHHARGVNGLGNLFSAHRAAVRRRHRAVVITPNVERAAPRMVLARRFLVASAADLPMVGFVVAVRHAFVVVSGSGDDPTVFRDLVLAVLVGEILAARAGPIGAVARGRAARIRRSVRSQTVHVGRQRKCVCRPVKGHLAQIKL